MSDAHTDGSSWIGTLLNLQLFAALSLLHRHVSFAVKELLNHALALVCEKLVTSEGFSTSKSVV